MTSRQLRWGVMVALVCAVVGLTGCRNSVDKAPADPSLWTYRHPIAILTTGLVGAGGHA